MAFAKIRTALNDFTERNDGVLKILTYGATLIGTPFMIGAGVYNILRGQPAASPAHVDHGFCDDSSIDDGSQDLSGLDTAALPVDSTAIH